jgi:Skp family chaperone for outer membrane proteins
MEKTNGSSRWFEIVYVAVLIAVLAVGLRWMGRGRVGVVDLSRVAGTLGMQAAMEEEAAALRQRTVDQAQILRQEWDAETHPLRQAYTAAETDGERERLRSELDRQQAQLELNMAGLRHETQQQQRELVSGFRDLMLPAVQAAAQAARVDIVVESGPTLLYRRDAVDLTDAVIRQARDLEARALDGLQRRDGPAQE